MSGALAIDVAVPMRQWRDALPGVEALVRDAAEAAWRGAGHCLGRTRKQSWKALAIARRKSLKCGKNARSVSGAPEPIENQYAGSKIWLTDPNVPAGASYRYLAAAKR